MQRRRLWNCSIKKVSAQPEYYSSGKELKSAFDHLGDYLIDADGMSALKLVATTQGSASKGLAQSRSWLNKEASLASAETLLHHHTVGERGREGGSL